MDLLSNKVNLCYKLRSERSLSGDIVALQWSPKMDLLALANSDGSVVLNRLSWQRVWITSPGHSSVTAISWRPDGRVLVVGHKDGLVTLREVEDAKILHKFNIGIEIMQLSWAAYPKFSCSGYQDNSSLFTCLLQPLDENDYETAVDPNQLASCDDGTPSVLMIGDVSGSVYLYVSGLFHVATVRLHSPVEKVVWTMLSRDLKYLLVVSANGEKLMYYSFTIPLLKPRISELNLVALKFAFISCLIKYINVALKGMSEAWEDALLLMDAKMADYAVNLPDGTTLADELLMLLASGKARDELKEFLINELTEKGLQKLGLSIKISYTTIKKIAASRVLNAITSLQYHMSELLGMSNWYDKFGVLGLSPNDVKACLTALRCFAVKTHELLLIIENSIKSGGIFFEWLILVIRKLSGEVLPATQHQCPDSGDLKLLINFLKKHLTVTSQPGARKQQFNMEVVGQYFDNQDLSNIMEMSHTIWDKIISHAGLDDCLWFGDYQPSKSLIQLFHCLHQQVDHVFALTNDSLSNSVVCNHHCELTTYSVQDDIRKVQALIGGFITKECKSYLYFPTSPNMGFIELFLSSNCVSVIKQFQFTASAEDTRRRGVISLQNYDAESLSVLFVDNDIYSVAQLSTNVLIHIPNEPNKITSLANSVMEVENLATFPADMIAVTGSRRLACIVCNSGKKIRLYDVDEDVNDDDNTQ